MTELPTEIIVTTKVDPKTFYPYYHDGEICCTTEVVGGIFKRLYKVCCDCKHSYCGCPNCG